MHILVDATSSRSPYDRQIAIENLKSIGANITTTESVILNLLADKNNPNFKSIQKLIKEMNHWSNVTATKESSKSKI